MNQAFVCRAERIFDGEQVVTGHVLIVHNERIEAIVPESAQPAGLPVVTEPGCTIIPGLIDMHMHFMRWEGPLFLAYGVTTVRDTGNQLDWILARRAEWLRQPWPRIYCLGPILDGPQPVHPLLARPCVDRQSAIEAVRETAAAGTDGIKFYVRLDPEWIGPMVKEAHQAGLKVSSHSVGTGELYMGRAGVDEVFHLDGLVPDIWPDAPPGWLDVWGLPGFAQTAARQATVANELKRLALTVTPTLAYWDSCWRVRSPGYPRAGEGRYVPATVNRWAVGAGRDLDGAARWRRALAAAQRFTGLLIERQVPILAGSDVPCGGVTPGQSLWRELALLVEAGMSPRQALQSATRDAAAYLGQGTLGCLRVGAAADLAFVQGDPLARMPDDPTVPAVIRAGRLYRRDELLYLAAGAVDGLEQDPPGRQWLSRG